MSKSYRRFEILLPLSFNDGQPVPDELIGTTLLERRRQFGAVSSETQTIHGTWSHHGQEYRDDLVRVFVDVADEGDAKQYLELSWLAAGSPQTLTFASHQDKLTCPERSVQ